MNRAQIIMFGVIGVIVLTALLVVFDIIPLGRRQRPPSIALTVWSLEEGRLWQEAFARYTAAFPNVRIAYVKKNQETYEQELLNALASGTGPDIFTLSNTQIVKHKDKLSLLPQEVLLFRPRDFRSTFFGAAEEDLITPDGNIIGLPLTVDTLALFYNRDFFNSANIALPPKTWEELVDVAARLTSYSEVGTVSRSGIALGTAANVEHAVDILSALLAQSGVELVNRKNLTSGLAGLRSPGDFVGPAESALSFYTAFADSVKRTYSWSSFFPNSLDAFAQGKTAIVFGYAEDVPRIEGKNPHLAFDISSFPQPKDTTVKVYYGRYRFNGVAKQSRNPVEAWRFLFWLADRDNNKFFADSLGLAPSRRDLVGGRPTEDYLEVFYGQVLAARTWLVPDDVKVSEILKEMINSVVNKSASAGDAVGRANVRVNSLLNPTR
ncbi:MAG: extracellular solute-binding protein [Candidatus Sungbacteria bacterium]|nr:extracellular solute-binding protein [Candidatus Sungbacteria bacterium]